LRYRRDRYEWEEWVPFVYTKPIYEFVLHTSWNEINAATDGEGNVVVSQEMIGFVQNLDQLAFVLAHEIAHVELNHKEGHRRRTIVSGIVSFSTEVLVEATLQTALGGNSAWSFPGISHPMGVKAGMAVVAPFSKAQEYEADLQGAKYLRLAGFDVEKGITFLEHLGTHKNSESDDFNYTHPHALDRFARLHGMAANLDHMTYSSLEYNDDPSNYSDSGALIV